MQVIQKYKFVEADPEGKYVSFGERYSFKFGLKEIAINKEVLPFYKVLAVEDLGEALAITYLGTFNVRKTIFITTSTPVGRTQKLQTFSTALQAQVVEALKNGAPESELIEAGPTICEICGSNQGTAVKWTKVFSLINVSMLRSKQQVLCGKHILIEVVPKQIVTGIFGWWGIFGFFWTLGAIFENAAALAKSPLKGLAYLSPFMALALPGGLIYLIVSG
ncbi:MAG: hypothetical protein H6510_02085 [Acidobacteria bacterium]|nr:hypothetical protein [Acidobacteriota bacterium]MCB9396582.1 hypothetical protein [Acidobacteriota bacterium]